MDEIIIRYKESLSLLKSNVQSLKRMLNIDIDLLFLEYLLPITEEITPQDGLNTAQLIELNLLNQKLKEIYSNDKHKEIYTQLQITNKLSDSTKVMFHELSNIISEKCPNLLTLLDKKLLINILCDVNGIKNLAMSNGNIIKKHLEKHPLISTVSKENKTRLIRKIAGRISILARVDMNNNISKINYMDEICNWCKKLEEPGDILLDRPLPIPKDSKGKRGGRKQKKKKELNKLIKRRVIEKRRYINHCTDDLIEESDE
ncbi:hypothetical protein TCON_0151 [Astathelohania contejeani]|uniref:Nop domain-containing protein n=1 Tax=Astathelohania contejeani TaxID=164912 RepID=A0ABQ7I2I6_9MICR|nr:hypothetical protein TCON_0151 [Thelohania contejeani]